MAEASTSFSIGDLLRNLECSVCRERFVDPRILSCGHTFCFEHCLKRVVGGRDEFPCPECRSQHVVPSGGIDVIAAKNFVVSRLLSKTDTNKRKRPISEEPCPLCSEEDDLRTCHHCNAKLCMQCLMKHLPQHVQKLEARVLKLLQQTEKVSKEEKAAIQNVKENTNLKISGIKKATSDAIRLIKKKSKSMESKVSAICDKDIAGIRDTYKHLKLGAENFQQCLKIYRDLRSNVYKWPQQLLKISKMLDLIQVPVLNRLPSPERFDIECAYVDNNMFLFEGALEEFLVLKQFEDEESESMLSQSDDTSMITVSSNHER